MTGLPVNAPIGSLYLTIAGSFDPIASQKGVFPISPRGTYEGCHRIFKACKKYGVQL